MNANTDTRHKDEGAPAKQDPQGTSTEGKNLSAYHVEALDRGRRGSAGRAERQRIEAERIESGLGDGNLLRKLWPFLRPERRWLTVAIVTSLITSGISLVRPLIMLWAIDRSVAT